MSALNNNQFEKYKEEAKEKWGRTDAYKEYEVKTNNYSKQKWNNLVEKMDHIMVEFALCMRNNKKTDSVEVQNLVEKLHNHITENYYFCTNDILAGLGKMYVLDDRFKQNIDKHANGTAEFICKAIEIYCSR